MLAKREVFEFRERSAGPFARLMAEVTEHPESQVAGIDVEGDTFERAILRSAAADFEPRIASLPMPNIVLDHFHLKKNSLRGSRFFGLLVLYAGAAFGQFAIANPTAQIGWTVANWSGASG